MKLYIRSLIFIMLGWGGWPPAPASTTIASTITTANAASTANTIATTTTAASHSAFVSPPNPTPNPNPGSTSSPNPNILFITVDDLNNYVGAMEKYPDALTPNMDRLASSGVLFTNAYAQAPICAPSRASMMTGLLPSTTGIYYMIDDKDIKDTNRAAGQSIFLPDYFENHGYKTLGVGKIFHQGDAADVYDEYGGRFEWFGPKPPKRMNYDPAAYGRPPGTSTDWGAFPEADSAMPDYKYAEWAIAQLYKEHEKPFFLSVGFIRPHVPWHVPQKWYDKFDPDTLETPPYHADDFGDIPDIAKAVAEAPPMPTTEQLIGEKTWEDALRGYLASTAFVDYQVGKVLDALHNSPYADNTIIVLVGDHGYHMGEKNRFAKVALWAQANNTPLIIAGPDIPVQKKSTAPAGLIDIYPTLLELAGLPANSQNEGHSLVPLMESSGTSWPHAALTTYGRNNHSVMGERYHYIRYENGAEELYDLKRDPNEWNNLAGRRDMQDIISRLKEQLPEVNVPLAPQSSYPVNEYHRAKSAER